MGARERADLGFAAEPAEPDAAPRAGLRGFDPAEWTPAAPAAARPAPGALREGAARAGFRSRPSEPPVAAPVAAPVAPPPVAPLPAAAPVPVQAPPRRRRTGRNAQLNLKLRPDTIDAFYAIADARGWGLGETMERAVALLQREAGEGG